MAISRGQMNRQLYGLGSLEAGAPSIKYEGDIRPQMASAPDIGATRNDAAMELFKKPLKDLTPEELDLLDEILASQASGGIMNAMPREMAGFGGLKKAFKKVTGAVKDIASSDIGKLALGAGAIYGLGGGFGPAGFSMSRLPGIGGFFAQSGAAPGSFRFAQDIGVKQGLIPNLLSKAGKALTSKTAMVGLGGAALSLLSGSGLSEDEITGLQRDPEALKGYLRSSYLRVNPNASDQEVETFVTENTREYRNKGGIMESSKGIESLKNNKKMEIAKGLSRRRLLQIWNDSEIERELGPGKDYTTDELENILFKLHGDMIYMADGGRIGYADGPEPETFSYEKLEEEIRKYPKIAAEEKIYDIEPGLLEYMEEQRKKPKTKVKPFRMYEELSQEEKVKELQKELEKEGINVGKTPVKKAKGGLMDIPVRQNQAGVKELDYRKKGGFVPPIGIKEKADDIPAMLSNNEFVFTADAVRAAGGGSVNKGAQRMYNLMKTLEGRIV